MTNHTVIIAALIFSCGGGRTVRDTSGATGSGPDFNGGFDRRPMSTYAVADGGTSWLWPVTIPDGWTMETGVWDKGVWDMYGEGRVGGAVLMCRMFDGSQAPCGGTGLARDNSALSSGACRPETGGCDGIMAIRSAVFPVTGGSSYALSVWMHGKMDFAVYPLNLVPLAGVTFQIDWFAGSAPVGAERIADDSPLTEDWIEHRYPVDAPPGATQASIRIEFELTHRDIRIDDLTLVQ